MKGFLFCIPFFKRYKNQILDEKEEIFIDENEEFMEKYGLSYILGKD